MTKISEKEFEGICYGIYADRDVICKHNPLGSKEEILLWMLVSVLISYLSLDEKEIPCFPNEADAAAYRNAILFILKDRMIDKFDAEKYLGNLCS
jgi:hypothetical protein